MQLNANTELQGGKYRIIRVIGQGGFGITYLAENLLLGRMVAIKEFFPKDFCGRDNTSHLTLGTQNNAETVEKLRNRFLKEARNIARLDHPGIVKIHDVFEENNTAYYVMDYIDGENLNEMVRRDGPLPEAKAIEYIRKVGDALHYIHSRNMTHFDVKPANIMVRRADNQPILVDFGLSKQYDRQGDATSTLMQGVSQGYSPIELYSYGAITSFSPQTDVYSLGASLYFLLSGSVPPDASSVLNNPICFHNLFSHKISFLIEKAMNPIASQRLASVKMLIQILENDSFDHQHPSNHQIISPPSEDTVLIANNSHNINGHEAVDLGLSVLWATKDIGAFESGEAGELFVWGDNDGTKTLKVRSSLFNRWFKGAPRLNNICGNPEYDTATKLWGGGWRMPTVNEVKELFDNTEWLGLGNLLKIFGCTGHSIMIDDRKHWTGESPHGLLMTYHWRIIQNELGVMFSNPNKDWSDCYFPIRPVIDRKFVTNN